MENIKKFLITFDADKDDLELLQDTLDMIWESEIGSEVLTELFTVFENNPEHDGFGVFWSILHGIETIPGYEPELCNSIKRKPAEFNILMAKRIMNPKSISSYKELISEALNKI